MPYTVRQASDLTGFSVETLRYYEKIDLVTDVPRDEAGRRRYEDEHLSWLAMLRCLRDTGMPIQAMCEYATQSRSDGSEAERLVIIREHAAQVDAHLELLRKQRQHLAEKIAWYEDNLR